MEQAYAGKAVITETLRGFEICIPATKNWFALLFLGFWLAGWAIAELVALTFLISTAAEMDAVALFLLFWIIVWTAAGVFLLRLFLWSLRGKELIYIEHGQLIIDKKGLLFSKPKTYQLNKAKNIRVDAPHDYHTQYEGKKPAAHKLIATDKIRFEYDTKTITFAGDIDEPEAVFILQKLKEKRILTDKNFEAI